MNGPSCVPVATFRVQTVSPTTDDVLDRQPEVGERTMQRRDDGLHTLGARRVAGAEVLVLDEIVGDQLVGDLEATLAEALVDQPARGDLG